MTEETLVLPEEGIALSQARATIDKMRGRVFDNVATGIQAQLSSSAKGKLISNKATAKSKANGFTSEQHNALAASVDEAYRIARLVSSRPDRAGDVNIVSIKRFVSPVRFGSKSAAAWITVKESRQHGHHIYSVEAIKLETLDRKVEVASGNTPHASSVPMTRILAFLRRLVKRAKMS